MPSSFQDSIYSGFGDPKNLTLIPHMLQNSIPGHLRKKVIPKVMLSYPATAAEQGWPYETDMRNFAFHDGLPAELHAVAADDIFMHTDADEVPSREALLFLKLHDNIPEPICLNMKKTNYGFFWYVGEWHVHAAATFGMMKTVFRMQPNLLRRKQRDEVSRKLIEIYVNESAGASAGPLVIGNVQHPAGFHCSWCTTPAGVRNKLISAINADFPRWGDYPMKCDLSYIQSLIAKRYVVHR